MKKSELKSVIKEIVKGIFKEMTTTGAVSPVSTPKAFSKRGVNSKIEEDGMSAKDVIYKDRQGGRDVYWIDNKDTGGKIFINPESVAKFLKRGYRLVQLSLEDQKIEEMTTTGDVSGYNVPAAFSKKGGSHRGVEGSAKLGYTLTGIGKQEMQQHGDPLYETKKK